MTMVGAEVTTTNDEMVEAATTTAAALLPSLKIPIQTTANTTTTTDDNNASSSLFVEIFPEELKDTSVSTLLQVLRDEKASAAVWATAGHLLVTQHQTREALQVLTEACDDDAIMGKGSSNATTTSSTISPAMAKQERVRVLATTGIATLLAASQSGGGTATHSSTTTSTTAAGGPSSSSTDWTAADQKFTQAGKVDTFFPMTWIGRGLLNLQRASLDQARFFFQTTKKQCGAVLPALLGMAAVLLAEKDYKGALQEYATAIRQFPTASGAAARVGFATAAYRLGQVDRAKAAFARARAKDPEYVPALVGTALLDMRATVAADKEFAARMEYAIKLLSVANLLDGQNAMVQNHLANHYFWKWTPVRANYNYFCLCAFISGGVLCFLFFGLFLTLQLLICNHASILLLTGHGNR